MCAQFLSAFADNALLVAAIAHVKAEGAASLVPLLQEFFVVPFILLAPFVGPFADSLPKGRVLMIGNALKLAGALAMAGGMHPLAAYGVVGVGAAAYSPAKYGILTQFFRPGRLVRANGLIEGSTIVAILMGVVAGGLLADRSLSLALGFITLCYVLALIANLFIPHLAPEHPQRGNGVRVLIVDFVRSVRGLWGMADARLSLAGTALFWGSGATLRLMLFAWVPVVLGIQDNATPANLMGTVSVGVIAGAVLAGACIPLSRVNRALLAGALIGPIILLLAYSQTMGLSIALLLALGACGGAFVVPLNALLQARGHETVGAGRALAVQNLCENGAMLLLVGGYAFAASIQAPVVESVALLGMLVAAAMMWLVLARLRSRH